jgi:DNA-directed RNA polymerase subunit M/transcription elongation factor TFIIS
MESSFCDRCHNLMKIGSLGMNLIKTCPACGFQKQGDTYFNYSIKRSSDTSTVALSHPLHYLDPCLERITTTCPVELSEQEITIYKVNRDGARGLTCTSCGSSWKA